MTQLEELLTLFHSFGIDAQEKPNKYWSEDVLVVTLDTFTSKVSGYTDSYCEFVFTPDGEFKEVGVWE